MAGLSVAGGLGSLKTELLVSGCLVLFEHMADAAACGSLPRLWQAAKRLRG
jgi:hypothetical protein